MNPSLNLQSHDPHPPRHLVFDSIKLITTDSMPLLHMPLLHLSYLPLPISNIISMTVGPSLSPHHHHAPPTPFSNTNNTT